ncbi:hypothetical protein DDF65_18965 [Caulobacter radicis]|uniref:Uncharacterized protein n=1 Tax=Caulobacter radicis TaxID=2172650 RepID=A0A2T9J3F4_9CAUL|nr:hypothetical protein DDF65_18965 [Caulobacter radicis]
MAAIMIAAGYAPNGRGWQMRRAGAPPYSRHSRPCGGNPSVSRKGGRGGSPAIRLLFTCERNQRFPPQGRE